METTQIIAKGTKVRIIAECEANSVKIGQVRRVIARFELPENQGGRHYRVSSTRTDTNFAGPLVPATALEIVQ